MPWLSFRPSSAVPQPPWRAPRSLDAVLDQDEVVARCEVGCKRCDCIRSDDVNGRTVIHLLERAAQLFNLFPHFLIPQQSGIGLEVLHASIIIHLSGANPWVNTKADRSHAPSPYSIVFWLLSRQQRCEV